MSQLKILVLGDADVGKTNLVSRYVTDTFYEHTRHTLGVDFVMKQTLVAGTTVTMQLWDTAGEERFRALSALLYRGAHGALIVYDITRRSTFDSLASWCSGVREQCGPNCPIVLVGNKVDLDHIRQVPTAAADAFAKSQGISFFETSALDNRNVSAAFDNLAQQVLHKVLDDSVARGSSQTTAAKKLRTTPADPNKPKSSCAC